MVCRNTNEVAMILHVQGTVCITASYTCRSWYGILNMYCIRFLRCLVNDMTPLMSIRGVLQLAFLVFQEFTLLQGHDLQLPLLAPEIVWAAQWVGISSWILQDANLGWERGEERQAVVNIAVRHGPPLLATTCFTEIKVFWDGEA